MNGNEPRVLAAGVERSAYEELLPVLQRDAIQVDWVATPDEGLELAWEQHFDIIILSAEASEKPLEFFVRELRRGASPSSNAALMVLAQPDHVDVARALKNRGVNRVMLVSDPPQMISEQMAGLLNAAPRVAARVPMNLMTALGNRGRELFCQTVNLSATGMLVRMANRPQLGSSVVFRLHLTDPESVVIGRGQMVRHASKFQGGYDGVGVRFVSFAGDGAQRLQQFLDRRATARAQHRDDHGDQARQDAGDSGVVAEVVPAFDPIDDPDLAEFVDSESFSDSKSDA